MSNTTLQQAAAVVATKARFNDPSVPIGLLTIRRRTLRAALPRAYFVNCRARARISDVRTVSIRAEQLAEDAHEHAALLGESFARIDERVLSFGP